MVNLNPNFLDSKRHSTVTFKENLKPDLNPKTVKEGLVACENIFVLAKGHGFKNKKRSWCNRRSLNKTICGRGGRFKLFGNSRFSLLKVMNYIAKFIGEQIEILSKRLTLKLGLTMTLFIL